MRGKSMRDATRDLLRPSPRAKNPGRCFARKIEDHPPAGQTSRGLPASTEVCEEPTIVAGKAVAQRDGHARSTSVVAAAARVAIAAERQRSARYVGVFRFVGITIACAMNLGVPLVLPAAARYQSDPRLFACYWVIAAVIFWTTQRTESGRRLVGFDVA